MKLLFDLSWSESAEGESALEYSGASSIGFARNRSNGFQILKILDRKMQIPAMNCH
jgi:hypothetical protein